MEIIEIARNMNFEVILFSNISLLDEEKTRKLAELYISQISCTIFSLDYRIHDDISSVKDSLKKVIRNVHLIKRYGIPLEIKTILMNKDPFAYRKLEVFCKKYSIDCLVTTNICAKTDCDSSPKELSLSFKQLEIAIPEIDKILNLKRKSIPLTKGNQGDCLRGLCKTFKYLKIMQNIILLRVVYNYNSQIKQYL